MTIDRQRLRGIYARVKGIQRLELKGSCPTTVGEDFNKLVAQAGEVLGEPTTDFVVPSGAFWRNEGYSGCRVEELVSKVSQFVSYLEYTQHVGNQIIEIGSIYNSIQDEPLKARCADLLSAPANFDRVINQATLVLEDRIRTKSGSTSGAVGVGLVNEAIKADPQSSIIRFSDDLRHSQLRYDEEGARLAR